MSDENKHVIIERDVVFMTDPSASFVSLVKRGANQTPWRVVKNDKEKAMSTKKVLAKLIAPKGTEIDVIKSAMGEDAQAALAFDSKVERGDVDIYEQKTLTAFKTDSLQMVTLDRETGLKGIAGELIDDSQGGVFGLFRSKKADGLLLEGEFDAETEEVIKAQYSEMLWGELYAFIDGVGAIMAQEKGDPMKKLEAIENMNEALMAHIKEALSVIKGDSLELKAPEQKEEQEVEDVEKSEEPKEEPEVKDVEKSEEPEQQTDPTPEDVEKSDEPKDEPEVEDVEKSDDIKALISEAVKEGLQPVQTDLEDLKESVSKMQKRIPSVIKDNSADDVENVEKADTAASFEGVFFK